MVEVRRIEHIADIARDEWTACFRGELENYEYFQAIERARIPGFSHAYYVVYEDDELMAAVPAFFTEYDLATTAEGWVRRVLSILKYILPLKLKLACLSSPETEHCTIGMNQRLPDRRKCEMFETLLASFEQDAKARGVRLLGVKDLNADNNALFGETLKAHGFCGVNGMPTAVLPIDFKDIEEYLSRLSYMTRKDMRRKLKRQKDITVEYRHNVDDIINDIYGMYLETKGRSDLQFEELTPQFFTGVLRAMGDNALCAVYYAKGKPIGFNLLLMDDTCLLDKFFCMREAAGREYSLYFLSWFFNVQLCLDKKLSTYQSGQAGYDAKLKLGSRLLGNWMYFRHRNRLVHMLLKLASPLLAFSPPKET